MSIGTNLLCLRSTARWKSCYYSNAVWLDLNATCSWYRYRCPIPDICCRYLIRFSLCYYSNAVSLDLNAICSRYRYRYPIPDIRCRYLIRFSLRYNSNAVSLDLTAICSRYRYQYPIPAVDTLPDVPFSILQFAYVDRFPPPLLHCSQGMVLLAALYSATFGPAKKLFAPWMKAGKSPPWKTVGKKRE